MKLEASSPIRLHYLLSDAPEMELEPDLDILQLLVIFLLAFVQLLLKVAVAFTAELGNFGLQLGNLSCVAFPLLLDLPPQLSL